MEKICLDLDAVLDFLRGEPSTVEKLNYYANQEEICITGITLYNLLGTVNKKDVVISFANSVTILPFDRKAAVIASKISKDINDRGVDPSTESLLTAATCMANDAFLFTKKPANFEGIRGLKKV
jgi:predicted nucleic acid-binding protein